MYEFQEQFKSSVPVLFFALAGGSTIATSCSQIHSLTSTQNLASASTASWDLQNTLSGVRMTVSRSSVGKVYYATYATDQGSLTANDVKTAASAVLSISLVANGTITLTNASTPVIEDINTLPDQATYTLYAVSENATGLLDSSVKKFTQVLPKSVSRQNYTSPMKSTEMRYLIHFPKNFYNDSANWPLYIYLHGNGETANTAGNTDVEFDHMHRSPYIARLEAGTDDVPMIHASVQCNYNVWDCSTGQDYPDLQEEFVNELKSKYRINPKKIYFIGMSYGGDGTWNTLNFKPTIAAASIIQAGMVRFNPADICTNIAPKNRPLWLIGNNGDQWYGPATLDGDLNTLKGCGGGTVQTADTRRLNIDNTTQFPGNVASPFHNVPEYTFNTPSFDYGVFQFAWWNGASISHEATAGHLVPVHADVTAALATAQSQLRVSLGNPALTLNTLFDWLALWSLP